MDNRRCLLDQKKVSGNGQFNSQRGIAFNSDNHMFVADCDNYRIMEFDENMEFCQDIWFTTKCK